MVNLVRFLDLWFDYYGNLLYIVFWYGKYFVYLKVL